MTEATQFILRMKDQIASKNVDINNPGLSRTQKDILIRQWKMENEPIDKNKQQVEFKTKKTRHAGKK